MLRSSRVGGYNKHYAFFNQGPVWRQNKDLARRIQNAVVQWPMVYTGSKGSQAMSDGDSFFPSSPLDNSPVTPSPAQDEGCPNGAGVLFSFGWPANGSTAVERAQGWYKVLEGIEGLPPISSVKGQAWSEEKYVMGAYAAWWPPGTITTAREQWAEVGGQLFFAGTEWSPEGAGYMNGAIHNGRRVGSKILCLLGRRPPAPSTC